MATRAKTNNNNADINKTIKQLNRYLVCAAYAQNIPSPSCIRHMP